MLRKKGGSKNYDNPVSIHRHNNFSDRLISMGTKWCELMANIPNETQ